MLRPAIFITVALLSIFQASRSPKVLAQDATPLPRPNILWLTSEDNGPELGCYGDMYADTPNIDRLAARGMIYLNAWSNAPVCAPARTTIISGMYPPGTGSQHMRSMVSLPKGFRMFPQYLREVGYFCTNNSKEDYNLRKPGQVWDLSSRFAHWKFRKDDQPFFSVFNITVSHESQIRKRPHEPVHDQDKAPVPPYHPDVTEVRRDWAQYYDKLTEMDAQIGKRLQELKEAGLAEDTIVFYYGDHGSGMPRSKRWLYQSGLRVPLVVYVPQKFRQLAARDYQLGGRSERLVGFIDLAPTVLSLAGITVPQNFQGYAFMGASESLPPKYLFGFRDRMDERIDLSRCVRDERYLYIRNYMPHKPRGQFLDYMFQTPSTSVWKQLYDAGKLSPPQTFFWEAKSPEELYDIGKDPHQIDNLANDVAFDEVLQRMRAVHRSHVLEIRDVGFLPEAEMLARSEKSSPYELGHDSRAYPLERILEAADLASSLSNAAIPKLIEELSDSESAVRYWAALGLSMRGKTAVMASRDRLIELQDDASPNVRIAIAEALAKYGLPDDLPRSLSTLIELGNVSRHSVHIAVAALGALDDLDKKSQVAIDRIKVLPTKPEKNTARYDKYILRLLESTLAGLESVEE